MIKVFTFVLFFYFWSFAAEDELLHNVEKDINISLENQIQLNIEKEQLKVQITEIQNRIKIKKLLIVSRLKALYSLKKFKWGELLISNNFSEFERNIKILKQLNKYDYNLFKDYSASFALLNLSRKNLLDTEELIKKNIIALKNQQEEFHRIENLRLSALKESNKNSLLTFKGQLSRPIDAHLKSKFGTIRDSYNKFYLINYGEYYTTKTSTSITAIGPGTVIFRDELQRWRETLIVQHADNYYSVYAGIKNSKKSVGDQVDINETLGVTASENFYFEMRHFDNPINPKPWYRERL